VIRLSVLIVTFYGTVFAILAAVLIIREWRIRQSTNSFLLGSLMSLVGSALAVFVLFITLTQAGIFPQP
jgi:hypothetical protein